jgi:hypothetical protein
MSARNSKSVIGMLLMSAHNSESVIGMLLMIISEVVHWQVSSTSLNIRTH